MNELFNFILEHKNHSLFIIFSCFLLAGMNIPISIDILMIICSILAAKFMPEYKWYLLGTAFLGCYFSAWIAYWMGRLFGVQLLKYKIFKKMLPESRLQKIRQFYQKHGFLTLLIGRFIPFGVRNGIFMSTGISKSNFTQFILRDLFTSALWAVSSFLLFYHLGLNFDYLIGYSKVMNVGIFLAFSVTVIAIIWYKRKKNKKSSQTEIVETTQEK